MPSVPLTVAAVTATLAFAAIVTTSPGVTDGPTPTAWSVGVWLAACSWVLTATGCALAVRRPPHDRSLSPAWSGTIGAVGPAALFVLAMPAVDHPLALGWLWIWSFALAADGVVQSVATGRFPARSWYRDGALLAGVVALSLVVGRVDVGRTVVLATGAAALSWLAATAIHAAVRQQQRVVDAERAAVEAEERRRRANWIHDELLGELRLARLRLETADGGTRQALSELNDIEHRLRLRQLDTELESGGTRLAEIVQPFVRMVTSVGCRVGGVPSADIGCAWVDARSGFELKRFFGVAVPNALLAGASLVVFELELADDRLVARVRDDAGGFDPDGAPLGRGRDRLTRELGAHRLSTVVDSQGTTFSCEFTLDIAGQSR